MKTLVGVVRSFKDLVFALHSWIIVLHVKDHESRYARGLIPLSIECENARKNDFKKIINYLFKCYLICTMLPTMFMRM